MKRATLHCTTPGFRWFGRYWSKPAVVLVVENANYVGRKPPDGNSEWVIMQSEFAHLHSVQGNHPVSIVSPDPDGPPDPDSPAESREPTIDTALARKREELEALQRELRTTKGQLTRTRNQLTDAKKELDDSQQSASPRRYRGDTEESGQPT